MCNNVPAFFLSDKTKNCMQGELRDKQKGKNDPPCMKCVSSDQISFMKTSERSNNNRQKTVKC